MVDLQELIVRARFIFSNAPKRYDVFKLVNGRNSTKDISKKTGRSLSAICQDIEKLRDFELISEKTDNTGTVKKEGAIIYEKTPLIKHISNTFFDDVSDTTKLVKRHVKKSQSPTLRTTISTPSENTILDICKDGEDQLYEFKSPGVKMENLSEEIAAYLHTKNGGIIFYGVDDNGILIGSDISRQVFDQRLQNSIRHNINPAPHIEIINKDVIGTKIILIKIPPWDRKNLYQYVKKERYLIRKGTNKFALKPEELKKLSKGEYIS